MVTTDPQLAAARALIKKTDPRPFAKVLEGGDLELTLVREGRVVRHLVDPYGRVTTVEIQARPRWLRGAPRIAVAAWFVLLLCFIVGASRGDPPSTTLLIAAALCITLFVGAALGLLWTDSRARRGYERDESVFEVVSLQPNAGRLEYETVAQMLAAERLASAHGDHAVARPRSDRTFEVVVETKDALRSLIVDHEGRVVPVHETVERGDGGATLLRRLGVALVLVGLFGSGITPWLLTLIPVGMAVAGAGKTRGALRTRATKRYGGSEQDWAPIERRESSD